MLHKILQFPFLITILIQVIILGFLGLDYIPLAVASKYLAVSLILLSLSIVAHSKKIPSIPKRIILIAFDLIAILIIGKTIFHISFIHPLIIIGLFTLQFHLFLTYKFHPQKFEKILHLLFFLLIGIGILSTILIKGNLFLLLSLVVLAVYSILVIIKTIHP